MSRRSAYTLAYALAPAILQGCHRDCCGPDHNALSLYVGVHVDSAVFRTRGEFALELVPADQTGETFVTDAWTISATLVSPSAGRLPLITQRIEPADTQLTAAAIDIDDSPSVAFSDSQRVRASAAQLFWRTLLGAEPRNQCALLDFGGPPSPGFELTRLLQTYTSAGSQLDAQLPSIQPLDGSTPLYHSALEVLRWTDTTLTQTGYGRYLVIITDGQPSDTLYRDSLFAAANGGAVRFFAVGVGPASDQGTKPHAAAVAAVRELATRTGGIYVGVTNAAQLLPALQTLAREPTGEKLLADFAAPAPFPARGQVVSGRVTVTGQHGTATANWAFVAP
ncbi:MAG TPA: vWA domain-containing protein [Gemmatimonadales bacterium]|nr:vWA domain-containing protein [Gemmatimonadales bacterium]